MILGAEWWEAATAVGTVGAVVVALSLGMTERARARRAERALETERGAQRSRDEERHAAMVSAWVEVEPTPTDEGAHYERKATVHVANESDRPVYNANVCIAVQNVPGRWTPVGPLAVPLPLPVLASRSRQSWDITIPLLACSVDLGNFMSGPTAAIAFTDPSGQRWTRTFDMSLARQSGDGSPALFDLDPDRGPEQLGDTSNMFNPVSTVLLFLGALSSDETQGPDLELIHRLLDPAAVGWHRMSDEHWEEAAEAWSDLGVAAHVHYPAPRVAYVKALTDDAANKRADATGFVEVPMTILTLRFVRGLGWRIFSIGAATPVNQIEFPERDLHEDFRGAVPDEGDQD